MVCTSMLLLPAAKQAGKTQSATIPNNLADPPLDLPADPPTSPTTTAAAERSL